MIIATVSATVSALCTCVQAKNMALQMKPQFLSDWFQAHCEI